MSTVPAGVGSPQQSNERWALMLLVAANLMTSVGGGRVLSASKGIAGQILPVSGSILAFLAGSSLGLAVLLLLRHRPPRRAMFTASAASLSSSLLLVAVVLTVQSFPGGLSSGVPALIAWLAIVVRCALWYASRSLRSNVAATIRLSYLALTESSYFLGFIIGLLIGPVALFGQSGLLGALTLDVLLLIVTMCADWLVRRAAHEMAEHLLPAREPARHSDSQSFWRLTGAFTFSTIACQVVIFRAADLMATSQVPGLTAWAEPHLAAFYLGVAGAAAYCSRAKPSLSNSGGVHLAVQLFPATRVFHFPLLAVAFLIGSLVISGILGAGIISAQASASLWSPIGMLPLLAIALGSATFEFLVLAIVGSISVVGGGRVAQAFGVAASAATISLFLMGVAGVGQLGSACIAIVGLTLSYQLVRTLPA